MHRILTLLTVSLCAALAQTTIDLGRQARNIDFSASISTKSFKTGTSLPSSCTQGETYLKLDAPPGQNIYACTSVNAWVPQGTDTVSFPSFDWNVISPTQAQISQGSFRFGAKVTTLGSAGMLTIQGSASGSIWIYASPSGSIVAAHDLGAGNVTIGGTGFVVDALGTGFPVGSLPLYNCQVVSGNLPATCSDLRTNLGSSTVAAGPSGALSVDCSSASTCVVDAVPGTIPFTGSANSFTGLNTFSHLRIPSGAAPDPQQCSMAGDAGKVWVQTTATSGRQLYVCEGAAGWRAQGGPVNVSTAANVGYVSTTPAAVALSAQIPVESANQVRVVLIPVANQVRIARLAASIAAAWAGKVRLGIYRADGSLITQTGDIETSTSGVRSNAVDPAVLEPGYYYFAWSVDNTIARMAGVGTTSMNGLFNHVAGSPGQGVCSQAMTASGLPATCAIVRVPDTDAFPVIAVAGFAQ